MAFSGSSYFAGVGTVVAAIGVGFACGTMITNSVVQPPNRLERVNGITAPPKPDTASPSISSSGPEQASTAKPAAQDAPPSPVVAAAPAPAANSSPAPQPQPAPPAVAKADAVTSVQEQPAPTTTRTSAPAPVTKSDDKSDDQAAKSERTTVGRAPDANRETSRRRVDDRKPSDGRKFSERRRRQDQDERRLDEATNVVRQMPRGYAPDELVEQDAPRFSGRPHRFDVFDDDSPRIVNEPPPPPRFGFFGN